MAEIRQNLNNLCTKTNIIISYHSFFEAFSLNIQCRKEQSMAGVHVMSYLLWVENPDDLCDASLVECWNYITAGRQKLQLECLKCIKIR